MSGLADAISGIFGGAPMEAVIAPTAAGQNPVGLGVIFMIIMAGVLFTGLIGKVSNWFPLMVQLVIFCVRYTNCCA